jgi:tetratricopeptide (TPR) repeat protein
LFNQNDLAGAQDEFQKALALNPKDFTALSTLGQIDISSGNLPQAIQNLQSAVQLEDDPDARQWLAMAYAQSGNFTGSAEQLQQALRVRPRSAITYALLSRVYSSMGHWTEALGARRQALDINPGDADGWNDMGVLEVHLEHYDLARDDFTHALQIDPQHALAQANLQRLQHLSSAR